MLYEIFPNKFRKISISRKKFFDTESSSTSKNRLYYPVLILGLGAGLTAFFHFAGQFHVRLVIAVCLGVFYFVWGVFYHAAEQNLHPKVILEYSLLSLLAVFILIALLMRA